MKPIIDEIRMNLIVNADTDNSMFPDDYANVTDF